MSQHESRMKNVLHATDPDLARKVDALLRQHDAEYPVASRAAFYICSRCGLLYQSMYGCGCPGDEA